MTTKTKPTTTIPFSGFYESNHDDTLDRALASLVEDDNGDTPEEARELSQNVQWAKVFPVYARKYLEAFNDAFKESTGVDPKLKFDTLDSPREYNFTTDRIYATLPKTAIRAMYRAVDKSNLDKLIHENFTSRSGFSSFYDNTLAAWLKKGKPETWDANQVGTLVEALWEDHNAEDALEPWVLMEYESGNGVFDDMVYDALDEKGRALVDHLCDERHKARNKAA